MVNLLFKRKGLLLFILYVTPLCVFLQSLSFATTNVYAACYMLLTAGLILCNGLYRKSTKSFFLIPFMWLMIFLMCASHEWLAVMQTALLILYLHSKLSEDLYGIEKLSVIILVVGILCTVFCIIEFVFYPLYAYLILPLYKPEASDVIQTLYVSGGMCGLMPQTADAAAVILNSFYVLVVLKVGTSSKLLNSLLILLLVIGLFLTAKRAHLFFGLVVWVLSYIFTSSNKKRMRNLFVIVVLGFVAIPCLVSIAPKLGENNVLSKIIFSFQNISTDQEDVMHGRDYLYEMAWKKVEEAPLTGIGWGNFKKTVDYRGGSTDVHNVYLQLWAECGFFVLLLYIAVLFSLIVKTINLTRFYGKLGRRYQGEKNLLQFSFCVQGFFIMYCFTGNCLYNISSFSMYIVAASIVLTINRNKKLLIA